MYLCVYVYVDLCIRMYQAFYGIVGERILKNLEGLGERARGAILPYVSLCMSERIDSFKGAQWCPALLNSDDRLLDSACV